MFTRAGAGVIGTFKMRRDGTGISQLLGQTITPALAPDGSKIAFGGRDGNSVHLYVVDLSTGNSTQLTHGDFDDQPAWSPDGKQVAFKRGRLGPASAIFVINSDGSGERRLTNDAAGDSHPSWRR